MYSPLRKKLLNITYKVVIPAAFIGLFFLIWEIICLSGAVSSLILPTPAATFKAFFTEGDLIMKHTGITLLEAVCGLACGVAVGFVLAVLMDTFKVCGYGFKPLLVITQTIPTIVIAPLISLWMGYDVKPKILLVALTTFFPIAIGLADGYRSTDTDMIDLMRSMGANRWKIFWFLKFPNALPNFFSALKISTTYAIVGAVVSEWVGALGGLGFYILRLQRMYAYDAMFATIMWIIVLSLAWLMALEIIKDDEKFDPSKITFVLDWAPNTNHVGLYVAKNLGYYAEEGLEVTFIQPGTTGCSADVSTGVGQFGIDFQEQMIYNEQSSVNVTAVAAVMQHNTSGILVKGNVNSLTDLNNKKYATWGLQGEEAIVRYFLQGKHRGGIYQSRGSGLSVELSRLGRYEAQYRKHSQHLLQNGRLYPRARLLYSRDNRQQRLS